VFCLKQDYNLQYCLRTECNMAKINIS
jgi:hypothetical protein